MYFDNETVALKAVEDGLAWGSLVVPEDFSRSFLKRLWSSFEADNETLASSTIKVTRNIFVWTLRKTNAF